MLVALPTSGTGPEYHHSEAAQRRRQIAKQGVAQGPVRRMGEKVKIGKPIDSEAEHLRMIKKARIKLEEEMGAAMIDSHDDDGMPTVDDNERRSPIDSLEGRPW